jgi:hypothetical protein
MIARPMRVTRHNARNGQFTDQKGLGFPARPPVQSLLLRSESSARGILRGSTMGLVRKRPLNLPGMVQCAECHLCVVPWRSWWQGRCTSSVKAPPELCLAPRQSFDAVVSRLGEGPVHLPFSPAKRVLPSTWA